MIRWALCLPPLYHNWYSCRLRIRIKWTATFRLLGVEAGTTTDKEFVHTDLVSTVNSTKMRLYKYVTQLQVTTAYVRGKRRTMLFAKSHL